MYLDVTVINKAMAKKKNKTAAARYIVIISLVKSSKAIYSTMGLETLQNYVSRRKRPWMSMS